MKSLYYRDRTVKSSLCMSVWFTVGLLFPFSLQTTHLLRNGSVPVQFSIRRGPRTTSAFRIKPIAGPPKNHTILTGATPPAATVFIFSAPCGFAWLRLVKSRRGLFQTIHTFLLGFRTLHLYLLSFLTVC